MYMQKDLKKNQLQDYKQAAEVQKKVVYDYKGCNKTFQGVYASFT